MSIDSGEYGKLRKFVNLSRKVTGTNLNKVPRAADDYPGDRTLLKAVKGYAHGTAKDERLNNKPMKIRKVTKGTGGESKLTSKKPATKRPRAKGAPLRRYK